MRKKSLYALAAEKRFCDENGICTSVASTFLQFSYNKKKLEKIAKRLNECYHSLSHWDVIEIS